MFAIEPWHWLVLGALLIISELFLTTFTSLWFGLAALIIALIAWLLPISIALQVFVWLLLSVVMVFIWFKYFKTLAIDRTKAGLGGSVIIGEVGMIITQPLLEQAGVVRFSVPLVGASEWECRTRDEVVNIGDRVVVKEVVGNELIVSKLLPTPRPVDNKTIN